MPEQESSRSPTPDIPEMITYITSFGSEEIAENDNNSSSLKQKKGMLYSEKLKENLHKFKTLDNRSRQRYSRFRRASQSFSSSEKHYKRRKRSPNRRCYNRSSSSSCSSTDSNQTKKQRAVPKDSK